MVTNEFKKCRVKWLEGNMAGITCEAWVLAAYKGKIIKEAWGLGKFEILEVLEK